MQKILLLSLTNQFLDRGANFPPPPPPPPPVQIGCKNSSVYIELTVYRVALYRRLLINLL